MSYIDDDDDEDADGKGRVLEQEGVAEQKKGNSMNINKQCQQFPVCP